MKNSNWKHFAQALFNKSESYGDKAFLNLPAWARSKKSNECLQGSYKPKEEPQSSSAIPSVNWTKFFPQHFLIAAHFFAFTLFTL